MSARRPRAGANPVAVVTVAYERRDHLERQRRALERAAPDVAHVVVDLGGAPIPSRPDTTVVAMEVGDRPLPLARARNLGAAAADADVLVFLDVDCIPSADLVARYAEVARDVDGLICGPVAYLPPADRITAWDDATLRRVGSVQDGRPGFGQPLRRSDRFDLFWSLSFAVRRATWRRVGGFDERFVGYGGEDTDLAFTARSLGVGLFFDGVAGAFHQHHPVSSPPVEHLDDIVANARRFHSKWGTWPMTGWLRRFADDGLVAWEPDGETLTRIAGTPPP